LTTGSGASNSIRHYSLWKLASSIINFAIAYSVQVALALYFVSINMRIIVSNCILGMGLLTMMVNLVILSTTMSLLRIVVDPILSFIIDRPVWKFLKKGQFPCILYMQIRQSLIELFKKYSWPCWCRGQQNKAGVVACSSWDHKSNSTQMTSDQTMPNVTDAVAGNVPKEENEDGNSAVVIIRL
jgi:hypothetical protein